MRYFKKFFAPVLASIVLLALFVVSVTPAFAKSCPPTPGSPYTEEVLGPSGTYECRLPTTTPGGKGIGGFIAQIERVLNYIIPFLIGIAVFLIIFGILGYISKAADEEKRKEARDFIIWGVLGVFAMLSIWGFVTILVNTFNLDRSTDIVTNIYPVQPVPTTAPTTLIDFINRANAIGSAIIPFLIGIAVFIIIFGMVNYVRQGDNEEKRAEGRMFIIWGVVSVFVMLSIWGFVNILVKSFQLDNSVPPLTGILNNLDVTKLKP